MAELTKTNGLLALINKSEHEFGEVKEDAVITFEFDFFGSENQIEYIERGCFDKETEVLTSEGWRSWPEVTGKELFLSTDPDTGKVEWVKALTKVSYRYKGQMDSFVSRNFDLMTTPEHSHYVLRHQNSNERELIQGFELGETNQCFINRPHGKWYGSNSDVKTLPDGYKISFNSYVELMGWYLSEGCCFEKKERPGSFVFDIRQYDIIHRQKVRTLVEDVFGKKSHGEHNNRVTVYLPKEIGTFFKDFGKSYSKYIPKDIKNSTCENIELFLKEYIKGDGHFNEYGVLDKSVIYTSSKQMADDLSEMIIKLGYRPSIAIREPRASEHYNGSYVSKIQYQVRIGVQEKCILKNQAHELIDYDGMVYDVTLEKYHTLFVRRNGKFTISGNCGCTDAFFDTADNKIKGSLNIAKASHKGYPDGETAVNKNLFIWLNDGQPRFTADPQKRKRQNPLKAWFKLELSGKVVK